MGALLLRFRLEHFSTLRKKNRVFKEEDDQAYMALQFSRLDVAAESGVAFPLIRKLLAFNADGTPRVEVAILSRNDPVSGLRVFRSAHSAGLNIERGVFTRGRPPFRYLRPLNANLFLSAHEQDVVDALASGFPAAHVYPNSFFEAERHPNEVRIAFDGDAVLFDDEAEQVFQEKGLKAFVDHENERARTPLSPGPFQPFLLALHRLQVASQQCQCGFALP